MDYLTEINIRIKHYTCFPIGKSSAYFEMKKLAQL